MRKGMYRSNKVPSRWEEFKKMGDVIPGTPFICFKVPLRSEVAAKLNPSQRFSPNKVIRQPGRKEIGLIIDLTFTDRYYDASEFENSNLQYVKIKCVGHDTVPSEENWLQFCKVVDAFRAKNCERLIGVHCTHGVNRTGYLVCRYMIEKMGKSAAEAIEMFNTARGHRMEKYTDDLFEVERKIGQCSSEGCHVDEVGGRDLNLAHKPVKPEVPGLIKILGCLAAGVVFFGLVVMVGRKTLK